MYVYGNFTGAYIFMNTSDKFNKGQWYLGQR